MIFPNRVYRELVFACSVSALSLSYCIAHAAEVGGVKLDDSVHVANDELTLNGAGIRYKAIFKVYVAALYLSGKKATVPAIIAAPGAKRMMIVLLRTLSGEDLGRGFIAGIQKNTDKAKKVKLMPQLQKFGEMAATISELNKGDVLMLDWIPGTGTLLQLNGRKVADPIPDQDFYDAFLRIWLGDNPADAKLKQMLSGEAIDQNARLPY